MHPCCPAPCSTQQRGTPGHREVVDVIETAARISRRPLVQFRLHRVYPELGRVTVGPRSANIHQRPPHSASSLRTRWGPSPCTQLSCARTTTTPPSHPGSIRRQRAFPPDSRTLTGLGTAGMVPTFTVNRSTGVVPSYAPAASPRLRRRLSPWPPHRRPNSVEEFATTTVVGARR